MHLSSIEVIVEPIELRKVREVFPDQILQLLPLGLTLLTVADVALGVRGVTADEESYRGEISQRNDSWMEG
jgi:hypothetical protein